jgi:hypothetical protein
MNTYFPDRWVVVKISSVELGTHYRVFGGWYGGFAGADSWKMNSGITKIDEYENHYDFHGESASVYSCNKHAYGMTNYMAQVFMSLKNQFEGTEDSIELIEWEKVLDIKLN